ncbi:MAG: hypothetical protein HC905_16155 [Bacteroidales bacterium]|nr:hypothetical protein [Bacteroidales bacterium]
MKFLLLFFLKTTSTLDTFTRKRQVRPVFKRDTTRLIQPIEFPPDNDTLLDPFFDALDFTGKPRELIRILHYGDSQIEADRITSYFRNQMQKQFGGAGVGMIPITPINPASVSYVFDVSANWHRYSILNTKKSPNEPEYGVLGCFSRFNGKEKILNREEEAWIFLKYANISYRRAFLFNRCKLLISGNRSPLYVELNKDDQVLDADIYPSDKNLRIIEWEVDTGARNLLIKLKGKDSPDLFAVSFDAEYGVAVDNIPLRGSSGLEFTRLFQNPYDEVLQTLNVRLIILQFGVNAVINMSKNVDLYEKLFLKQLRAIRMARPDIPVVVIGVNDISVNTTQGYTTNEAVTKVRDAQRRASFDAGCVFWDMFEGMGGENSMPSWVMAKPSLAQKDFIHLNSKGARIIGEMFYRSLMNEYEKYLQRNPEM